MNEPKVTDLDYINFLLAAPRVVSCTEGARVQPDGPQPAAHDALNRLLNRLKPDTAPLWQEAEHLLDRTRGLLIIDDTTLDKPYAQKIALVHRHWSGKHHRIVSGINLVTLVWSDDTHAVPCDYRLFDAPNDGVTKNDHFQAMLQTAKKRGFTPRYVCFDGWYSSLANLKLIRSFGWQWLTRLKANRLVNPDGASNRPLADCSIRNGGTRVHLKGYGFILVFRIDTPDGDTEYWATSDEYMTMGERTSTARQIWTIETYHRDIKQFCGVERCMVRSERAQRNHIGWALRTYLRLIWHEMQTGTTRFATKLGIIRPAVQQFLTDPSGVLCGFPQAGRAHKRATA
jgi:DDE superfamily endonuclease